MCGIKGCCVCGKDHRENSKHPPEKVTASINRLKSKNPKALITIEDLPAVVEMTIEPYPDEEAPDDAKFA